ncbi:MAG TPA: heavy metal translocating P-type ATPase [Kiloniellales bacterium]|jgi:Cu2+-exporting ATPase
MVAVTDADTLTADTAAMADPSLYVRTGADGAAELNLAVENLHCPGCIPRIEGALRGQPGVLEARVNLTSRRLRLRWRGEAPAADLLAPVLALGYRLAPFDADAIAAAGETERRALLRALAVAGFAAGNVMLLSVSVWSGLAADMGAATRSLLHWVSALIALPAVAYAGRPFFASAVTALRGGRLNMDVPISLAVLLTTAMSLFETVRGGPLVYFDAAVMLLFFLLIGRTLDLGVRGRVRSAAENLLALRARSATLIEADGRRRSVATASLATGARVAVAAGERIPADGRIVAGRSDIDTSLVTGESLPRLVGLGDEVFAGTVNLGAPLEIQVTATGEGTLLAEIGRLMTAAEQGRARYVRLADRAARIYAPTVHGLAAATFLGWLLIAGAPWQSALMTAVAVLIITCPCALGLAVPAVQVTAVARLLRRGVLVKSADGLERLAQVDAVVFDKTGTLTLGRPELVNGGDVSLDDLRLAASLACVSRHPLARALCRAAGPVAAAPDVREEPGMGLEAAAGGRPVRLGHRSWCGVADTGAAASEMEMWLAVEGRAPVRFAFRDAPRTDAGALIGWLRRQGFSLMLLSGDRPAAVRALAEGLGIADWQAECRPAEKTARLADMARAGQRVLMVGDGLNDAPALAAAHVSASPAEAADISQTAADVILQGDGLAPLAEAIRVARLARRLVLQNFALAFGYNAIAVPLAVAGHVTPLIAAAAMSASSIAVTLNALRLNLLRRGEWP